MVIDFTSPNATLEIAGGKGANLARLKRAGFEVPPGFIVSTAAYRSFVDTNGISEAISAALRGVTPSDIEALESTSVRIRAAFKAGRLPVEIGEAIRDAYA